MMQFFMQDLLTKRQISDPKQVIIVSDNAKNDFVITSITTTNNDNNRMLIRVVSSPRLLRSGKGGQQQQQQQQVLFPPRLVVSSSSPPPPPPPPGRASSATGTPILVQKSFTTTTTTSIPSYNRRDRWGRQASDSCLVLPRRSYSKEMALDNLGEGGDDPISSSSDHSVLPALLHLSPNQSQKGQEDQQLLLQGWKQQQLHGIRAGGTSRKSRSLFLLPEDDVDEDDSDDEEDFATAKETEVLVRWEGGRNRTSTSAIIEQEHSKQHYPSPRDLASFPVLDDHRHGSIGSSRKNNKTVAEKQQLHPRKKVLVPMRKMKEVDATLRTIISGGSSSSSSSSNSSNNNDRRSSTPGAIPPLSSVQPFSTMTRRRKRMAWNNRDDSKSTTKAMSPSTESSLSPPTTTITGGGADFGLSIPTRRPSPRYNQTKKKLLLLSPEDYTSAGDDDDDNSDCLTRGGRNRR